MRERMVRAGRGATAILLGAAIAAGATGPAAGGSAQAATVPATLARVTVERQQPGRQIPRDFVGFSLEVSTGGQGIGAYRGAGAAKAAPRRSEQYALGRPGAPNRALFHFMRDLGPGVLRLGGNSQDNTCWDTAQSPHPEWCKATLNAGTLRLFATAARASGWRLMLGLNLKQNDPAWAMRELTEGVAKTIPRSSLLALEIGNEPDLFSRGARPHGYSPQDDVRDFLGYLHAIRGNPATRGYAVAGPATCCAWRNARDLGIFLDGVGAGNLALATVHNYMGAVCNGRQMTIAQLLDARRRERFDQLAKSLEATAQARGVPIAMAETNTVACGGMPGVSDAFAAAAWGVDYMFTLARDGYRQVNFHFSYRPGGGSSYNPVLTYGERAGHGWRYENIAEPLYYAMYLFARHAAGARLAPARVESAANVHAYAVSDCAGCGVRVFVVNEDLTAGGQVTVAGAGGRAARLLLLQAPSLSAKADEVRLGGAQFDGQGRLGKTTTSRLAPNAAGDYVFTLPNAAIAMLTVTKR